MLQKKLVSCLEVPGLDNYCVLSHSLSIRISNCKFLIQSYASSTTDNKSLNKCRNM